MRLKRLFIWVPVGVLLLLAGVVLWAFTADLGRFKPHVEGLVSEQLGREFAIDGELHVHLGRTIEITATGLRVANPDWAESPSLATVGALATEVDLLSLLEGPIIIESLRLADADVNAETSAEGEDSWVFAAPKAEDTSPAPLAVLVRHIELLNFGASLGGPGREEPLTLELARLTQQHLPGGMLEISTEGQVGTEPLRFDGSLGPFENLLEGRDVSINGQGALGNLELIGKIYVDYLDAPQYPTFELLIEGPDIAEVARLVGREESLSGAYRIEASAERRGLGMGIDVTAAIGEIRLDTSGASRSIQDFSVMDYIVAVSGPDLGAFGRLLGKDGLPEQAFSLNGAVRREQRTLDLQDIVLEIGGTRLQLGGQLTNFPNLNDGQVQLDVSGPDIARFRELLGFEGIAEGAFDLSVVLDSQADGTDLLDAELNTSLGRFQLNGTLGEGPTYAGTRMQAQAVVHDTGKVMGGFGVGGFPSDPLQIEANFELRDESVFLEPGTVLTLRDDRLEVEGLVGFDPLESGTDLRFSASGSDVSQLAAMAGQDLPLPGQPYRIGGGVSITDAGYQVNSVNGNVGPNLLALDGLVTRREDLAGTDFTFGLEGPNLETLVHDTADFDVPAEPFQVNGHIRHLQDRLRFEPLNARVGELRASAVGEVRLPFDGSYAQAEFDLAGPDINVLLPESDAFTVVSQPFEVKAAVDVAQGRWTIEQGEALIADASLKVEGVFDQLPDFSDTDIRFTLDVPNRAAIGSFKGDPSPDLPVNIQAHITGNLSQVQVDELIASVGQSDFDGRVVADFSGDVPMIDIRSRSRVIDTRDFRGPSDPDAPAEAPPPDDGRLIPDIAFPLEEMASLNARVNIQADEYRSIQGVFYRDFRLDASLQDGALVLNRLHAAGIEGSIDATLSLHPVGGGRAEVATKLTLDGLKLNLSRDEFVDESLLPVLTLDVQTRGAGSGLREAVASLSGHVYANGSAGVIPQSALSVLDKGLLQQIFGLILPKTEESETTHLQCFAARLEIQDGTVEAAPGVAIVTKKVQIISEGSIDLKTEKLDLTFQTRPTKAYQANVSEVLINPFVKISGTMAKPKPTLDAGRAILFGGTAAATGGLSILAKGLWDRMSGSGDPCAKFLEAAKK